jgi:hypothetical protein
MTMLPELTISKLDAARRQLETAARLYFTGGDPVSVHTLTAAAYNILKDLNAARGGKPMIVKETLLAFVKPEHEQFVRGKINEAENFLKHADRDPAATLTFRPLQTEFLLLDASWKYHELAGEQVAILSVFIFWFVMNNSNEFKLPENLEAIRAMAKRDYAPQDRYKFMCEMLPLAMNPTERAKRDA